jgi:hypothetical protein
MAPARARRMLRPEILTTAVEVRHAVGHGYRKRIRTPTFV